MSLIEHNEIDIQIEQNSNFDEHRFSTAFSKEIISENP